MSEQPFRKKRNSVWFREQEREQKQERQQTQIEKEKGYSDWSNSNVLQNPTAVESLKEWCYSVCPEVMLATVRFFLDKIREDNMTKLKLWWLRSGGWKGVTKDLKKAEKAILDVYDLGEEK